MAQDYNKTLNLPNTEFPMRAGLPQSEPVTLKKWDDNNIYGKLMEKNAGKPMFILHDGPPYANGNIHLGTALNKVLKDFIVRYKNMSGFCAPFVPGWDTHGLPTELKARAKAGVSSSDAISDVELRQICRDFALGYLMTREISSDALVLSVIGRIPTSHLQKTSKLLRLRFSLKWLRRVIFTRVLSLFTGAPNVKQLLQRLRLSTQRIPVSLSM